MTTELVGRRQLTRTATTAAPARALWSILTDSRLLPRWAPVVHEVERCDPTGERLGAVRRCRVELGGKPGRMVERCVALRPERQIAYLVEEESFGMRRMVADYGFRISLEPVSPAGTRVTIETFYTPRTAVYGLMNALLLRPRLGKVVDDLIAGLIRLAEAGEPAVAGK
jgi:uncharacterized protein YndB with AHSA1/START domain